uniref:Cadherin domain-containing protein n=1 Tax=Lygus hesperus TaxID=30085 RepID=A0A0K8SB61_LYGHE
MRLALGVLSFAVGLVAASITPSPLGLEEELVPRLSLPSLEAGYHGLVKENETLVEVTPKIVGVGAKICDFHIVNKHHGEAPFQIILKGDGEAELRARKTLNCEKRKNYKFDIAAISCTGQQSENATVHITVVDINEYAPAFLEPSYVCQVDEGRLYSEIVRVEATDRDCTPKYGDICKYEILTTDQPFTIDNEGTIRNTEPLDYERSHNHILSVVAYDCGMKQSQPIMVTVKVNRICKVGWKGMAERIDYVPGSGREDLFPTAQLKLCDMPCTVHAVQAKLSLATKHIDKGCDRDTYSVSSQRKICGASSESVELLTPAAQGRSVSTDDGHEADQIFEFDGVSSAISVPQTMLDHGLASTFTMSVWLKHKHHTELDKHAKEHIICSADDHKMNRHHYAWFVRNCRLILLLRRDFSDGDLNIFRPAEWRWKLPQVCDDEWHHYAVSVRFPEVDLYVDGSLFKSEKKNPEVIDDWPLHPTKGINTTLTVGACWQGSEKKMKHHLHGYLAGLSVLLNKVERPSVLACLHKCKESLDVPPMELLEPGMELLTNSDLTELSIEGDNKTNLEVLIKKIGYTNSREFPTPGRRNLHLTTTIMCEHGRTVKVPNVESYVMVLPPQQPTLIINGSSNLASDYHDFRKGVHVFADVHISVSPPTSATSALKGAKIEQPTSSAGAQERKLDSCVVTVYPSLNPDHETLAVPTTLMTQFGITAKLSKDGATLSGSNIIYNYEQILRQIEYNNRKPAYYLNRVFKLICSEMNGRFLSNEYVQTLTVIHPRAAMPAGSTVPSAAQLIEEKVTAVPVAHAQRGLHHVDINQHYLQQPVVSATNFYLVAGHAVTIIMVVCVGFLVVMIVLGVVRIRAVHQRHQQEEINDAEMAWDDSALNITVNPMEEAGERRAKGGENSREDDSSDEGSSYRDDEDEETSDEDEAITVGKLKDLEWDNSTLA